MGHVNYASYMESDRKGLTVNVSYNGQSQIGWNQYRYPLDTFLDNLVLNDSSSDELGGIFQASFNVADLNDTFIQTSSLIKGYVWVNGHNLGRYWNIGP